MQLKAKLNQLKLIGVNFQVKNKIESVSQLKGGRYFYLQRFFNLFKGYDTIKCVSKLFP